MMTFPVDYSLVGDLSQPEGEKKRVKRARYRSQNEVEARSFFLDAFGNESEFVAALEGTAPEICLKQKSR